MASATIIVPPFLKFVAGPLLGPAMLVGAGRAAGHDVDVVDVNARFLAERLSRRVGDDRFVGDHDRPSAELRRIQSDFRRLTGAFLPSAESAIQDDPTQTLPFDHDAVMAAATMLAGAPIGRWMTTILEARPQPDVVGVSVLYSGQVIWGLAASLAAKRAWPQTLIVWGGPHVTALQDRIAADVRYGTFVERFVFGYAERTFVAILDAVDEDSALPFGAVRPGTSVVPALDDGDAVPDFSDLHLYGTPRVTLPAQVSRGCAYGKCRFCTYPAIEGQFRPMSTGALADTIQRAVSIGGAVALKDSLLLPTRLKEVAGLVAGRVGWSACTKLHRRLDAAFLRELADGGCRTLEFGLETLTPSGQLVIDKRQSPELFLRVLDAATDAGISVVVNYITGFPGVARDDDARWLTFVKEAIDSRCGLVAKIELNNFQLERLSPMGRAAVASGLRVTEEWPWATVLGWEEAAPLSRAAG